MAKAKKDAAKSTATRTGTVLVTRSYIDGEINKTKTDEFETVALPEGVMVGGVTVLKGASTEYAALKASVSVHVPCVLGEETEAGSYASKVAESILNEIIAGSEDSEASAPAKGGKKAAAGKKSKKVEEPEEDDEDDADDADDADDEDGVTAEDINAMDRKQLEALIAEAIDDESLEEDAIDLADFKKTKSGLAELRAAVVAALVEEDDEDDGEGDEEDDEADDEDGDDDEEDEGYTEAELKKMSISDLKDIYKEWEMGKFPKGKDDKAIKKTAVAAILEAQDEDEE